MKAVLETSKNTIDELFPIVISPLIVFPASENALSPISVKFAPLFSVPNSVINKLVQLENVKFSIVVKLFGNTVKQIFPSKAKQPRPKVIKLSGNLSKCKSKHL